MPPPLPEGLDSGDALTTSGSDLSAMVVAPVAGLLGFCLIVVGFVWLRRRMALKQQELQQKVVFSGEFAEAFEAQKDPRMADIGVMTVGGKRGAMPFEPLYAKQPAATADPGTSPAVGTTPSPQVKYGSHAQDVLSPRAILTKATRADAPPPASEALDAPPLDAQDPAPQEGVAE